MDEFYEDLKKRIPGLPDLSASSRGALYRVVVASMEKRIAETELPALEAASLRMSLDEAIKKIEAEFVEAREKLGQHAPQWALPPEPPPPIRTESSPAPGTVSTQPSPSIAPDVTEEWNAPAPMPARRRPDEDGTLQNLAAHLRIVNALLVRNIKTAAGTSSPAYFWLTIEPLLQVGLVVSLYWLFDRTLIYGMPAIPFAIIGVGGWLMFRTMLLRIATGLGREFVLCYFPIVSRFDIYFSKALFFGLSYLIATVAMLAAVDYFDIASAEIKNPSLFAMYWVLIWAFSFGFALTFNYIFVLVPSIKKLLLVLMRGLYLVSAVVIVTEQFPSEDKAYVLWNPLVHGMQLLRSAYFYEYSSDDANPAYFIAATVMILTFGLLSERAQRRREIAP